MASPLIVTMILFSGFYIRLESMPSYLRWIQNFSWFKYGYEALSINQWQGVEFHDETCHFLADRLSDMTQSLDLLDNIANKDRMFARVKKMLPQFQELVRDPSKLCLGDTILDIFHFNSVSFYLFIFKYILKSFLFFLSSIYFGQIQDDFRRDIVLLCVMMVAFRFLAYCALVMKTYKR